MATGEMVATRSADFFHSLDARDQADLRAALADDSQGIDEISRSWVRGKDAIAQYFRDNLPRMTDIHSEMSDVEVRQWGDVALETFVLHQTYTLDGIRFEIEAPTTTIWHLEDGTWKLVLSHSVPLAPAP